MSKSSGLLLAVLMVVPLFASSASAYVPNFTDCGSPSGQAPKVAGDPPCTGKQDAAIVAVYGPGAPFGTWQKQKEPVQFWLHDACNTTTPPQVTGGCAPQGTDQKNTINTQFVGTGEDAIALTAVNGFPTAGKPVYFPNDPSTGLGTAPTCISANMPTVLANTRIFAASATGYGEMQRADGNHYFEFMLQDLNPDCTPVGDIFAVNALGGSGSQTAPAGRDVVQKFSGDSTYGDTYGYLLKEGHHLRIRVSYVTSGSTPRIIVNNEQTEAAVFHVEGAYPSSVTVVSDSVRMNLWTTDRFGSPAVNFGRAATTATEDRRMTLNAAEIDTWGNNDCVTPPAPQSGTSLAPSSSCPVDGLDQAAARLLVRDVTVAHSPDNNFCSATPDHSKPTSTLCFNDYINLDVSQGLRDGDGTTVDSYVQCCNDIPYTTHPILYCPPALGNALGTCHPTQEQLIGIGRFQYTFIYGSRFPDGAYQIEFHDANRKWEFPVTVHVGSTGFSFKFETGEGFLTPDGREADHVAATGEPTKFSMRVTNSGGDTDTFGISVPVPGAGWTATVSPTTVTLPAGGFALVDVLVTPSSGALPGDSKVIAVTAVSNADNSQKILFTRTTLTAAHNYGATLTTTLPSIVMRPSLSKNFAVILHNNGTLRDSYLMSNADMPDGWSVNMAPSFLGVYAASREAIAVTLTAPPQAPPGTTFTLTLKACPVEPKHGQTDKVVNGQTVKAPEEPCAAVTIPVSVFLVDDVAVSVLEWTKGEEKQTADNTFRDAQQDIIKERCDETGGCADNTGTRTHEHTAFDQQFDEGGVYRMKVSNLGDRTDSIHLTAAWEAPRKGLTANAYDGDNCEDVPGNGYHDGIPDGWRFQVLGVKYADGNPALGPTTLTPGLTDSGLTREAPHPAARFVLDTPISAGGEGYPDPTLGPQRGVDARMVRDATEFSGSMGLGTLTLPAHTSQYVYMDMYWVAPKDGPGNQPKCISNDFSYDPVQPVPTIFGLRGDSLNFRPLSPSPSAGLRVTYQSNNDPALRGDVRLHGVITGRDLIVAADSNPTGPVIRRVLLQPGIGQETEGFAPLSGSAQYADYNLVATNTGEDYDTLKIRVDVGKNGWTHEIRPLVPAQGVGIVHGKDSLDPDASWTGAASTRSAVACTLDPLSKQQMTCTGIGVGDDIQFVVRDTPPVGARVGAADDMAIQLSSGKGEAAGLGIFQSLNVRTFAQGFFGFVPLNLANTDWVGYRGQTIAFPYTIRNVGLSNDRYKVTLDQANSTWNPQLSSGPVVAVPGGYDFHGFLGVTVPTKAKTTWATELDPPPGGNPQKVPPSEHFRIKIEAVDDPGKANAVLDFFAPVRTTPDVFLNATPLGMPPGARDRILLTATDRSDSFKQVVINGHYIGPSTDLNPTLPRGYTFTCLLQGEPHYDGPPVNPNGHDVTCSSPTTQHETKVALAAGPSTTQIDIQSPPNQLGISRVAHRFKGTADTSTEVTALNGITYTDGIINLKSVYGVKLIELTNKTTRVVPPGATAGADVPTVLYNVTIVNSGLSPQTVLLSDSGLPTGWKIFYDARTVKVQPPGFQFQNGSVDCPSSQACRFINPQDQVVVQVGIQAPAGASPGDAANFIIYGTVQEDKTQVAQLALTAIVGQYAPAFVEPKPVFVAPQEKAVFVIPVTNNGTVFDKIRLTATLPDAVKDNFPYTWEGCDAIVLSTTDTRIQYCDVGLKGDLDTHQTRQVTLSVTTPDGVVPTREKDPGFIVAITAQSLFAPKSVVVAGSATVRILDYVAADVDGDGAVEYAIDRDQDLSNGFEEFRENLVGSGVTTTPLDMNQFLSEAAAKSYAEAPTPFVVTSTCEVAGRTDVFLDTDGDGIPDVFWIPALRVQKLVFARDVNGDGVSELFIDCDGDGHWDEVYNLVTGEFTRLLQKFVNGDSILDYIVDANHNGIPDEAETVLFGGPGGTITRIVHSVDMNGDGKLDTVVDEDGDGNPDYFIPNGQSSSIAIVLKDVTGDKLLDWTYDSSGQNGRPNAYYDPQTHTSGLIDTKSQFLRDLASHWYIFALFGLALVLFVVLVMVTRRR